MAFEFQNGILKSPQKYNLSRKITFVLQKPQPIITVDINVHYKLILSIEECFLSSSQFSPPLRERAEKMKSDGKKGVNHLYIFLRKKASDLPYYKDCFLGYRWIN